jgi:hypothetical protein
VNASNTEPATVACTLAGYSSFRAPVEGLAELRRPPGLPGAEPLPATFLKHAEEQTVVVLAAVFEAVRGHNLAPADTPEPFRDWGVIAAPRFLGRTYITTAVPRFHNEGAWGVSPHLIPHRSLHSVSGTVSQALRAHGPNFGVGGGPGSELEGLLAAITTLHDMKLPGVWVVFSRLTPETACDPATGRAAPGTTAHGLALALVPQGAIPGRPTLELTLASGGPAALELTLVTLEGLLGGPEPEQEVSLGGVARLALRWPGRALAGPHPSFFTPGAVPAALAPQRSDCP